MALSEKSWPVGLTLGKRAPPLVLHCRRRRYCEGLVVPASVDDASLREVGKFRSKQRLPALSWLHPRKVQSRPGESYQAHHML